MNMKRRLRFLARFLLATISLTAVEIALAQPAPVTGVRPATTAQPTSTTRPAVASPVTPIVPLTLATPLPQLPPPLGQAQVNIITQTGYDNFSTSFTFYIPQNFYLSPAQLMIPTTVFPAGSTESKNAGWFGFPRPGTRFTHVLVLVRRPDTFSPKFAILYDGAGGLTQTPVVSANSTITITSPNPGFGVPTNPPDTPPTITQTFSNLFFQRSDPTQTTLWVQYVDPTTKQPLEAIVVWACQVSASWPAGTRSPPCP